MPSTPSDLVERIVEVILTQTHDVCRRCGVTFVLTERQRAHFAMSRACRRCSRLSG